MPDSIFPLLVFGFGITGASILSTVYFQRKMFLLKTGNRVSRYISVVSNCYIKRKIVVTLESNLQIRNYGFSRAELKNPCTYIVYT